MFPRTASGIRSGLYIRLKGIGGASGGCGPTNDTNPKNGRESSDFAISSTVRSAVHHSPPRFAGRGVVGEGKTSQSVRPWVARGNRTPDASRKPRTVVIAFAIWWMVSFFAAPHCFEAEVFVPRIRIEAFRLQKFDSQDATSSGPGNPRNALPSPRLDPPQHLPLALVKTRVVAGSHPVRIV